MPFLERRVRVGGRVSPARGVSAGTDPSVMPALEAGIHADTDGAERSAGPAVLFLDRRVRVGGRVEPGPGVSSAETDPSVMPALEAGIHADTDGAERSAGRAVLFLDRRVRVGGRVKPGHDGPAMMARP